MKSIQMLKRWIFILVFLGFALGGCSPATPGGNSGGGTFSALITKPSNHALIFIPSTFGLPLTISVTTDQPANSWSLYMNGGLLSTDEYPSPVTGIGLHWNVPGPGLYNLKVVAHNSQNNSSGDSNVVTVCVTDFGPNASSADMGLAYGYTGACPPPTANTSSNSAVFIRAVARPGSLAENFQCGATPPLPILSFTATLNDPANRTMLVTVAYSVLLNENSGHFDPQILTLNQVGVNTYIGSTDSTLSMDANFTNLFGSVRSSSESPRAVEWIAKAWAGNGELLASDGPHEIPVNPCRILPEPTETPVPTIPVPPNPNQHGGSGCSQYSDQTSCNLAGCSWSSGSCIVNP